MNTIDTPFGKVEILEGTKEAGISVLVIEPGKEVPSHYHKIMKEIEIILEGKIEFEGKIYMKGETFIRDIGNIHGYKNNTDKNIRILCITIPPYIPEDEYQVK